MDKAATVFLALVFMVPGVGAYRSKESFIRSAHNEGEGGAMLEKSAVENNFCASSRCEGYSDEDVKSKNQLKFRFPDKELDADPMGRADVATVNGYEGYHHGKLMECTPVPGIFSYSRKDWAMHMQSGMREGKWPNQPGVNAYRCVEKCTLQIFNEEGETLKTTEVWVERDGHSGDLFSKIGFFGWSAAKCVVGNALQVHWWQQQYKYYNGGRSHQELMVDPEGLPVFPFAPYFSDEEAALKNEFSKKFCALPNEKKVSVTDRVSYLDALGDPKLPRGFPKQCDDGWKASHLIIDIEDVDA